MVFIKPLKDEFINETALRKNFEKLVETYQPGKMFGSIVGGSNRCPILPTKGKDGKICYC